MRCIKNRKFDFCFFMCALNYRPYTSTLIFLQRLKLATSNSVQSLGLLKPIIKLQAKEKVGVALG